MNTAHKLPSPALFLYFPLPPPLPSQRSAPLLVSASPILFSLRIHISFFARVLSFKLYYYYTVWNCTTCPNVTLWKM